MAIGKFSNKNWLARLGASLGLPELGLSELLMGDTRASKLAKDNASTRVAGTNGGYLSAARATFSPNSKGGQSYYNQGMVNLATPLNMANAEGAAVTQALKDKKAKEEEMLRLANTTTGTDGTGGTAGTAGDVFVPVTFLGQTYTDPESLAIAKRNYLDLLNREKLQEIVAGLNRYVGGENASWDTVGGEIGEKKTSFLNKIAQYLDEYNKGEQTDYGKIRGYYSGLGDMYQSSQEIRNRNVADEYGKARTDLDRQKTEGLTGLQRSFQDYIDQANQNKTALARNYMSSMDELANANESDLQNTMASGLGNTPVQITNPELRKATTGGSTSLLNSLQRVKNNVFRINRGDNTEKDILSYLYQGI